MEVYVRGLLCLVLCFALLFAFVFVSMIAIIKIISGLNGVALLKIQIVTCSIRLKQQKNYSIGTYLCNYSSKIY